MSDPLWSACYRYPRGHLVRLVAAQLRAEHPGESIATDERIAELISRVEALKRVERAVPSERAVERAVARRPSPDRS